MTKAIHNYQKWTAHQDQAEKDSIHPIQELGALLRIAFHAGWKPDDRGYLPHFTSCGGDVCLHIDSVDLIIPRTCPYFYDIS